jgi:hypothetical protein
MMSVTTGYQTKYPVWQISHMLCPTFESLGETASAVHGGVSVRLSNGTVRLIQVMHSFSSADVIFRADMYGIGYQGCHNGNRRFGRLIKDYTELYRSAHQAQDRELVVMEVVRVWRSLDPPGRFIEPTEASEAAATTTTTTDEQLLLVYHDIGDEAARQRSEKLLEGEQESVTSTSLASKHQDDNTASTANSSGWIGGSTARSRGAHQSERAMVSARTNSAYGDCFGGSFRGFLLGLFAKKGDHFPWVNHDDNGQHGEMEWPEAIAKLNKNNLDKTSS